MYAFQMDVSQPLEMYDRVTAALEQSGQAQPPDRLLHMCVQIDGGFRITEVWESHEACDRYGDVVMRPTIERVAGPEVVAGPPLSEELGLHSLRLDRDRVTAS